MPGPYLRRLLAVLGLTLVALPAHAQYTILNLGTLGGTSSAATAINARGDVAGYAKNALGQDNAFLVPAGGSMQNLGTLGGANSYAYGINSLGYVVGSAALGSAGNPQRAFLWDGTTLQNLGALGGPTSVAYGINDLDDVVGSADTSPTFGNPHGFLWRPGLSMQDLSTLGGQFSVAFAVSDARVAVGTAFLAGNTSNHASRWSGGGPQDLGVLGGQRSVATAVGTDGTIAGYSEVGPSLTVTHAFVRPAGGGPLQDLGTLGGASSQALAINDDGLIVGWGELLNGNRRAAYRSGGGLVDLNALLPGGSGWTLLEARGVNNVGQIVGVGILGGDTLAYLLSPVSITGAAGAPSGAAFAGAFPNPVRDHTQFSLATASEGEARLEVLDVEGRRVRTLVRGRLGAGRHLVTWDGRGDSGEALPAGLYLARFQHGPGPSITRRVSLVR